MTTENKDRTSEPTATPGHETVSPPDLTPQLDRPQASYPRSAPTVRVTRTPTNPLDAEATRQLLLTTLTPDGYKCPKCGELIASKEAMIEHIASEINDSLLAMQDIFAPGKATIGKITKLASPTTDRSIRER